MEKVPTEHEEQRNFVQWFRRTYPAVWIFAIPNGDARSRSAAGRLKAEGVSAGVPDLYIPAWRLWIEMKRIRGGSVSPDQKRWHDYLRGLGDEVVVAKGCEAAMEAVRHAR